MLKKVSKELSSALFFLFTTGFGLSSSARLPGPASHQIFELPVFPVSVLPPVPLPLGCHYVDNSIEVLAFLRSLHLANRIVYSCPLPQVALG